MQKSDIKKALQRCGYKHPDQTVKDIALLFNHYKGLLFSTEPFVFNNGKEKELGKLEGTIPVPYKGQNYNIPICVWLLDLHPETAPICYVKPTADMCIKVSRSVDHDGKIYHPVLASWDSKSDLLALVHALIMTFQDTPPVYAKQSSTASALPYPTQPYMAQQVGSGGGSTQPVYPYPQPQYQQTPYPSQQYQYPYPSYSSSGGPAYPPYGAPGGQTPYNYPYPPVPGHNTSPATNAGSSAINSSNESNTGTITEEHIRASLLSAVEDKVKKTLNEQGSKTEAEIEILRLSQQELERGKETLDGIISRLTQEKGELEKNVALLKDKELELGKAIERLSDQEPVDVDEAVTTTAPLYKQILNAYAEEAATEDTIYYMGEALRRGVIDLDVFLKQVRTLSRKQFMLRALMQKCRIKAGLL